MIRTILMKSRGIFTVFKPAKQAMQTDPVCGMVVDTAKAFVRRHHGQMNYFCCPECKKTFEFMIKGKTHELQFGIGGQGMQSQCVFTGDL